MKALIYSILPLALTTDKCHFLTQTCVFIATVNLFYNDMMGLFFLRFSFSASKYSKKMVSIYFFNSYSYYSYYCERLLYRQTWKTKQEFIPRTYIWSIAENNAYIKAHYSCGERRRVHLLDFIIHTYSCVNTRTGNLDKLEISSMKLYLRSLQANNRFIKT